MRRMAFTLLAISLPTTLVLAQTTPTPPAKPAHVPTHMPAPQAEPENPGAYASPARPEREGPSEADVGPVQKHFVRAFKTDDLAETENEDNAHLNAHEKIAIDKRISVPKIHDVQDDNQATNTGNDALDYEIKYLNWGATTHEQQLARQGHYFTITWNNDGPKADFVARFQYRQVKSKEVVRTLMQTMPAVSGTTRSYFAVVDKAYLAYGPVCSWRFTILKGDTIVAESKSFIW